MVKCFSSDSVEQKCGYKQKCSISVDIIWNIGYTLIEQKCGYGQKCSIGRRLIW